MNENMSEDRKETRQYYEEETARIKAEAELDGAKARLKPLMNRELNRPKPSLTIEIFDAEVGGKGQIYCKEMKCDFPSGNIEKDVAELVKGYLALLEAYQ